MTPTLHSNENHGHNRHHKVKEKVFKSHCSSLTVSHLWTAATTSLPQLAKRALVTALLALASLLQVQVDIKRTSSDKEVRQVYGRLVAGAGKSRVHSAQVRLAKIAWEEALAAKARPGRPPAESQSFTIKSEAVLLTYQSVSCLQQWGRFLTFVTRNLAAWGVKYWCATLETCQSGRLHIHLMLQFHKVSKKVSRTFTFEGVPPNASANDYLNEGLGRRNPQQSMDRGFFYVYASKKGTVKDASNEDCVVGNYLPAWASCPDAFTYKVLAKWVDSLWRHYKLDDAIYEGYIFAAREGVQARKRNLDACKAWKEGQNEQSEMDAVIKRVRGNASLYQPFPEVPAVISWLKNFECDMLRYPLLILKGASASGKTEFAKSPFKQPLELKVGNSQVFPSKMVEFKRGLHNAIILDDVRDLDFLVLHQEKLQGKYDNRIEFATTQGGTCFYTKYLFQIPTVVTINCTTRNMGFLDDNDWLSKPQNRVLVLWPPM